LGLAKVIQENTLAALLGAIAGYILNNASDKNSVSKNAGSGGTVMRGNAAVTNSGLNKNTKSGNQNNAGNAEQAVDETVEEPTERKEDKAQGSGTQEPPL